MKKNNNEIIDNMPSVEAESSKGTKSGVWLASQFQYCVSVQVVTEAFSATSSQLPLKYIYFDCEPPLLSRSNSYRPCSSSKLQSFHYHSYHLYRECNLRLCLCIDILHHQHSIHPKQFHRHKDFFPLAIF